MPALAEAIQATLNANKSFHLFAQLAKYDEATGYFEATAADESLDKSQEIFDYEKSKPHFQKWSDDIAKATDGKSVGNVRAMHGKVAAGKLTSIVFDDEGKAIKVAGLIVDANEKTKMSSGVYTGVSIGGGYGETWDDPVIKGATRYEAIPAEISIVDNPCNKNAHFTIVKSDGTEELRKLHSVDDVAPATEAVIEPVVKTEPVAEKNKLPDFIKALSKAEIVELRKLVEPDAKETARMTKAAKYVGNEDAAQLGNAIFAVLGKDTIEKSLWDVGCFANALQSIGYVADSAEYEASYEGDGSTVPAAIRAALKPLADAFVAMAREEVDEMIGDDDGLTAAAKTDGLSKAASPFLAKLDATDEADALNKLDLVLNAFTKLANEHADLTKKHADMSKRLAVTKGVVRGVEKVLVDSETGIDKIDDKPVTKADGTIDHAATAAKLMKNVLSKPLH